MKLKLVSDVWNNLDEHHIISMPTSMSHRIKAVIKVNGQSHKILILVILNKSVYVIDSVFLSSYVKHFYSKFFKNHYKSTFLSCREKQSTYKERS